jgi:hypothetical protein
MIKKPLNQSIQTWFLARGMIQLKPIGQAAKAMTEIKEYIDAVKDLDPIEVQDAIGDIYVCLFGVKLTSGLMPVKDVPRVEGNKNILDLYIGMSTLFQMILKNIDQWQLENHINDLINNLADLSDYHDMYFEDCVGAAYESIKDRKGMVINEVFVKYDDLDEADKAICDITQG